MQYRFGITLAMIGFFVAMPAGAQSETKAALENPPTLAGCLDYLDWDPAERGTLLVVAPQRARLAGVKPFRNGGTNTMELRLPPGKESVRPGKYGFRLSVIASRYRRKVVTAGALSAVVPNTMAVLRYKNLPEPDLLQGVSWENRPQILFATLDAAQWRKLLSADGLGVGDLSRDQQRYFVGVFPPEMQLHRAAPADDQSSGKTEPVPFTDVARRGTRLRLYKNLRWDFAFRDPKGGNLHMGDGGQQPATAPTYSLQIPIRFLDSDVVGIDESDWGGGNGDVFGVNLMESQPNRLKASDLNYDAPALSVAVSLDGAKTVGELVARVQKVVGWELYADRRYAELPVYIRAAGTARAGDVLKALAYSVTGTFRRMDAGPGAVFVLTDDRVGSGTRLALMGGWLENARYRLEEMQTTLQENAAKMAVFRNATWSGQGDMTPSSALEARLFQPDITRQLNGMETFTPIGDLPPGVQERVRRQQESWREQRAENNSVKPIREDGVVVTSELRLACVIPDIGMVPLPQSRLNFAFPDGIVRLWGMLYPLTIPPDEKTTLPARISGKIFESRELFVRVRSDADARDAARIAGKRGFNSVLLAAEGQTPETVAGWLAAAHTAAPNVRLSIQVPLLWRPRESGATNAVLWDKNIVGETYGESVGRVVPGEEKGSILSPGERTDGEYIDVTNPVARQNVTDRVVALAKCSPHVQGILFTDTLPFGYAAPSPFGSRIRADRELGYTAGQRLAFLRDTGTDPVDLSPFGDLSQHFFAGSRLYSVMVQVSLPFFPDPGPDSENLPVISSQSPVSTATKELYPRWYASRTENLSAAMDTLHEQISARTDGSVRLYVHSTGMFPGVTTWTPTKTKVAMGGSATKPTAPQMPGEQWNVVPYQDRIAPDFPEQLRAMRREERFAREASTALAWTSGGTTSDKTKSRHRFLLDLRTAPVAELDSLLSQIVVEP
ncbi:MAG: hypothetical protein H7145_22145 [Akkermansiaceae bacterium]|nr:hypothetical protein [Armatimonadota bacterium]